MAKRIISEEKKKEYLQARKQKTAETKQRRREEVESGNIQTRRLAFIRNIIKNKGLTMKEIAEAIGMTQQNLSWLFSTQDDCYLGIILDIFRAMDIDCKVSFEYQPKEKEPSLELYSFGGNLVISPEEPEYPPYVTECAPDAKLRFLADYITDNYENLNAFCKRSGANHTSLRGFFTTDDIKIGILCKYAENIGTKIHWELNQLTDKPKEDGKTQEQK